MPLPKNGLWSKNPQQEDIIKIVCRSLPHHTDREISEIIFGHPLLMNRSKRAIYQHIKHFRRNNII